MSLQMASYALNIVTTMAHLHVSSVSGSWSSGTSIIILRAHVTLAAADLNGKPLWDAYIDRAPAIVFADFTVRGCGLDTLASNI